MLKLDRPLDETCLFFDVDGSLIDIAPRPDAVVVPTTLVSDLHRASRLVDGALALVSGRTIAQLDALFGPERLRASGVHGAEMRYDPDGPVVVSEQDLVPDGVWDDLLALLAAFPGTVAENKRFSFAIHFRHAPTFEADIRHALEALLARYPSESLRLMPGHFVFEIKRDGFNKGLAIRRFLAHERFAGRKPIFIGDDVTDQPGFAAALDFDGRAYSVGARFPGTSGAFADPAEVRNWIMQIARMESLHA